MSGLQAPRGTFDVLPADAAAYARVLEVAGRVMGRAGYGRIETPTFESTELFARGVGESTDIVRKEMYSFDDGGGRSVTLRPEGTASVCRAYIEHGMHKLQQPVRLWYSGSFYRHEAPQAGRYRQFTQIGAEAFGSDRPELDAELVILLVEILEQLGVTGTRLKLGSLGTPATRADYREKLTGYLNSNIERLPKDVAERIESNPMRAFDSSDPNVVEVMAAAPLLMDQLAEDDREHFDQVCSLLDAASVQWERDPRLVRGLDYYSRTVFEVSSPQLGAQSGVGGGGRYDALVGLVGGPQTPAVGWAAGVERILLAASPDADGDRGGAGGVLVVADGDGSLASAQALAISLRRAGLVARLEVAGRSMKAAFKHADRTDASAVAIVSADRVSLKDMDSGEQVDHPDPDAVVEQLTGGAR